VTSGDAHALIDLTTQQRTKILIVDDQRLNIQVLYQNLADVQLYKAKQSGRNRSCAAEFEP
jgi:PleD family two-component response regulator